jgi:hypothetical protein
MFEVVDDDEIYFYDKYKSFVHWAIFQKYDLCVM